MMGDGQVLSVGKTEVMGEDGASTLGQTQFILSRTSRLNLSMNFPFIEAKKIISAFKLILLPYQV